MNLSTPSTAGRDANGNPITADADTIDRYDRAIDELLRFRPEAVELASELAGEDSPAPMAHVLIAYLHLMSTDAADLATARDAHQALVESDGNAREQAHAAAIGAWLAGDWNGAARRLDDGMQNALPVRRLRRREGPQLPQRDRHGAVVRQRVAEALLHACRLLGGEPLRVE